MLGDFYSSTDDDSISESDSTPITNDVTQFFRLVSEVVKLKIFENVDVTQIVECKTLEQFLSISVWKSDNFCFIMLFFNDLQLKSFKEKDDFFVGLIGEVRKIPTDLVVKRLLKRFLTIPFFSEPSSVNFMPFLLSIRKDSGNSTNFNGMLGEEDYKTLILPFVSTCLLSRNLALRIRLLQTIEYYGYHLEPSFLLDEISAGLYDTNDDVCMCSMDSLFILAKFILKSDDNNLMKIQTMLHRFCVSKSMNLAIRSHALLCLVKFYSVPKCRKGIVLGALEICLYDVSSELKLYALNIIMMNMNQFDPRELVSVVMNLMLPLNLDQNADVRTKSLKVMRHILNHLDDLDLSKYCYGNVTSSKPDEYIASLKSEFPSESKTEPTRSHIFQGALLNLISNIGTPSGTPTKGSGDLTVEGTPEKSIPLVKKSSAKQLIKDDFKVVSQPSTPKTEVKTPKLQQVVEGQEWNSEWNEKKKKPKNIESDDEIGEEEGPDFFAQAGMVKKDKTVKDLLHDTSQDINLEKWDNNLE
jgi:hypothetical protein